MVLLIPLLKEKKLAVFLNLLVVPVYVFKSMEDRAEKNTKPVGKAPLYSFSQQIHFLRKFTFRHRAAGRVADKNGVPGTGRQPETGSDPVPGKFVLLPNGAVGRGIQENVDENEVFFAEIHVELLNLIPDFRRILRRYQKIPAKGILQFTQMLGQLMFELLCFLL